MRNNLCPCSMTLAPCQADEISDFEAKKPSGLRQCFSFHHREDIVGVTGLPHYVVSKGAVFAFARFMARELGDFNFNVNSIAQGIGYQ